MVALLLGVGILIGALAVALRLLRRNLGDATGSHAPTLGTHTFSNKPPDSGPVELRLDQFRHITDTRPLVEPLAALQGGVVVEGASVVKQSEPPDDSSSGSGSSGAPTNAAVHARTLVRRRPPGRPERS
jgi:hypothetical protein